MECWHELSKWTSQRHIQPHDQQLGPHPSYEAEYSDYRLHDSTSVATDPPLDSISTWHLNPGQLTSVINAIRTIKDQEWLDVACINLPLCLLALQKQGHVQYVPLEFHHPAHVLEEIEIAKYRAVFLVGCQETQKHSWICTLANREANHWFGLLGHPQQRRVFVLGREMVRSTANIIHSWHQWGGPQIWKTICRLHDCDSTVESVQSISWTQNGHDCGPDIC